MSTKLKTLFHLNLKCFRGVPCLDEGEWTHCSEKIEPLAEFIRHFLAFNNNVEKEWGKYGHWYLLSATLTIFQQYTRDGLLQFYKKIDLKNLFDAESLKACGINELVITKNETELKRVIFSTMEMIETDHYTEFKSTKKMLKQKVINFDSNT